MRRGLPITLWRHVLGEQARLVLVTCGIVVAVVAFAASIKPIADGNLDPLDAPRFMLFAVVPMLAYVLPFAGGFGTTLAYHRLAQDNETLAAHAGGIGHRSVLLPACAMGLALSVSLLALNEQVIPRFLRSMERMVTRDLARVVVRSVEQGRSVPFGDGVIFAESAQALGGDAASGAYERIVMRGVAFLETPSRADGEPIRIDAELFTSAATVWLYHGVDPLSSGREGTLALARLGEAVMRREGDRTMVRVTDSIEIGPTFLPGAFTNDPKFLTFRELAELGDEPERMEFIAWRKREVAYQLARVETFRQLRADLRESGRIRLSKPLGEPVLVEGSDLVERDGRWIVREPAGGTIEVMVLREGGRVGDARDVTRWRVRSAEITPDLGPTRQERRLALDLHLTRAEVVSAGGGAGVREALSFGGLLQPDVDPAVLGGQPIGTLLAQVEDRLGELGDREGRPLREARDDLVERMGRLEREVLSKRHERLAMSVSCLVMVLTGAVVAMRLRHATPLVVYLWSFFPALAALITINGGQQLVHRLGEAGLPLLWGGNAGLMLYTLIAYRGLARH